MKSEQHETNVALHSPKTWKAGTLVYSSAGLAMLFFWLLWGDFTWAMKDRAVGPSATLLIKQIGVSDFLYALIVIAFPNFTNIILGPVISYLSDRHRGPYGRRIPFLAFTTPFIVLGLYGLGLTPWLGGELHELFPALSLHGGRLVVFCVSWVLLDFGTTLAGALFNALVNDVVPRELLGRFYGLFRMISLGAGVLFNFFLLKEVEHYVMPIFIGIGTLYGIGLLCLCLKVKEGSYPPPETEEGEVSQSKSSQAIKVWRAALTYLRQSFSLGYYRKIMLAQTLLILVFGPVNGFSIIYAGKLGIGMDKYGLYIAVTYACSFALSYFLGMLADRYNPLRTGGVCLSLYAALMISSWFLLCNPVAFGPVLILHGVVSGSCMTLTASLQQKLFPRELFAQFASATGIIASVANMLLIPVIGKLLDLLNNNYRCLFPIGALLALSGVAVLWSLSRDYARYGGDEAYQAPKI